MFDSLNKAFNTAKRDAANNEFIMESVFDADEVLPGSDEEIEDLIDVDSVPDEVYQKLDAELDRIVSSPTYDDAEAEELADDDDDDFDDDVLDAVVNETAADWLNEAAKDEAKKSPHVS